MVPASSYALPLLSSGSADNYIIDYIHPFGHWDHWGRICAHTFLGDLVQWHSTNSWPRSMLEAWNIFL